MLYVFSLVGISFQTAYSPTPITADLCTLRQAQRVLYTASSLWHIYVLCCARFDTIPSPLTEPESRFIGLCVCVAVAGAGTAEVSAAQRRGHRWPPPNAGLFLLSAHSKANLALTVGVSSWHIALFIALIIVRLRHFLESNRGAKPGSETFRRTDESAVRGWPESRFILSSLCARGKDNEEDVVNGVKVYDVGPFIKLNFKGIIHIFPLTCRAIY